MRLRRQQFIKLFWKLPGERGNWSLEGLMTFFSSYLIRRNSSFLEDDKIADHILPNETSVPSVKGSTKFQAFLEHSTQNEKETFPVTCCAVECVSDSSNGHSRLRNAINSDSRLLGANL